MSTAVSAPPPDRVPAVTNLDARGRDADWPRAPEDPRSLPFDSVVVRGTGIGALTFAARMARVPALEGRVTLVGDRVKESRRLINGVTLRARALDYLAAAFGCMPEDVLGRALGARAAAAATYAQEVSSATRDDDMFVSSRARFMKSPGPPLTFGMRNSRLNAVLHELATTRGVLEAAAPAPATLEALTALARGKMPLIVNAAPGPIAGAQEIAPPPKPEWSVAAYQVPFRPTGRASMPLPSNTTRFAVHPRDGGLDVAMYCPFQDELSPDATYYGVITRVMRPLADKPAQQLAIDGVARTLVDCAACFGYEPVDPKETEGRVFLPVSPWNAENAQQGVFDLHRIAGAGAPIISGDGMLRAALGALASAEAYLAGEDPVAVANAAVHRYRRSNRILKTEVAELASFTARFVRWIPRIALWYPHTIARRYDMWSSRTLKLSDVKA